MTIPLQTDIIYGPVNSRRYGTSLGINLLPTDKKICTFDCVYCQYGESEKTQGDEFPETRQIEEAVRRHFAGMKEHGEKADWIMISGNGEGTLHPDFLNIVDRLIKLRDEYLPQVPIGILSNSTTCRLVPIRNALMRLDGRFMKLDAGGMVMFQKVNEPVLNMSPAWADIIDGLYHLPDIVLQSMFLEGDVDNTGSRDVEEWIKAVQYIRPLSVQLYSVSRGTRVGGIRPVSREKLEEIAAQLTLKTGIPSEVFD